jgi:hypothetical protein
LEPTQGHFTFGPLRRSPAEPLGAGGRRPASFDGDPLIRSVAVSSSATLTAEPFVQSPQLALHTELFADGWSSQTQQQCLAGAFSDYSGWKHTPIDYAFNPFVT